MTKLKILFVLLLAGMLGMTTYSQVNKHHQFPKALGYVSDFEGIFTAEQIQSLDSLLQQHEAKTTNQVVVVTISSYKPYETLFDYSLDMANQWGVGQADKDNGVAIVFGKAIREIRIQVGYGLENKLEDQEAKRILDQIIIPEFKTGDYYTGIRKGLLAIIKEIE